MAITDHEGDLHALDLPSMQIQPTASTLLPLLNALSTKPVTFVERSNETAAKHRATGHRRASNDASVVRYLTSIIASSLQWIADESTRERIWELASARLSERAGRTAMPSIYRSFTIPRLDGSALEITLFEPSLTGDDLGHKTWTASFLLSRLLLSLRSHLLPPSGAGSTLRALELGSGTGLLGIAFAALFPRAVIDLTDLPAIVPNLAANLEANRHLLEAVGSSGTVRALDWAEAEADADAADGYELVLVADPLYSSEHPGLIAKAVDAKLARTREARLVLELPLREAYAAEIGEMKDRLAGLGLVLVDSGEEVGVDDWEGRDGERLDVKCWWGVWQWADGHFRRVAAPEDGTR